MKSILKFLVLFAAFGMHAQTAMTGTVLQQPCNNDGQLAVSVTGLVPPITYNYYLGNQNIVHSNVNSTSDLLTSIPAYVTWGNAVNVSVYATSGSNGAYGTFTLALPFNYSVSIMPAVCPAMGTVQAYVSGGTAPYTYQWTSQATGLISTSNPLLSSSDSYSLSVTDAAGCQVLQDSITVWNNSPIALTYSATTANCTNGTAFVNASNGTAPYTYQWNNGATTPTITGLSQGSYQCVVTDAQGCNEIAYVYVQQSVYVNFYSTITNATCLQNNGAFNGFVSGGTAPYTILWNNGSTSLSQSGLTGGQSYSGQITDANGCTGSANVYVGVSTPISVTYNSSVSSCTAATGSATVNITGGTAPYSVVWNTAPVLTGTAIANVSPGNYYFDITDAVGCKQGGAVTVSPVSTINAQLIAPPVICSANTGNAIMNVNGSNPPYTYAWNTGATTNSISGVPVGGYQCTVTDALGCSVTKYASLNQTSNISLGVSSTPASCLYASDGSAYANATGGTAPYVYTWSNAQTGQTATGLTTGYYYVTVTDANGCVSNYNSSNQVFVGYNATNNSCYCTISGTVYDDANGNCTQDAGENGIPNLMIHCSGYGYAFTNANGAYSFKVPGGTYTLTEMSNANYPLAACQTNNQTVSVTAAANCTTAVNFANTVIPVHDLHIITTGYSPAVPGNNYYQRVIVQNDGSVSENTVQLGYTHDGQLNYGSSASLPLVQQNAATYPNWYSITSGFPALAPGSVVSTMLNYMVPTNIPINTQISFFDTVAHIAPIETVWLTDQTPWNNVNSYQTTIVSSYDPNFKEVSPKGLGPAGNILQTDSVLNYVIHFQNEGTYFAQNIFVLDTLDSDLDWTSVKPGYSDHHYTATVSENGVLRFDFKNINLPWKSNYGDMLSSGMVSYSVKLKKNLAQGTQLKNTAAIYFDYNEPVITNTTLNTISSALSVKENEGFRNDQVVLYPNPAQLAYTIKIVVNHKVSGSLIVMDINGRELSNKAITLQEGENTIQESSSYLPNGVYFVKVSSNEGNVVKKLIIAK